ncbi:winged helix-turn-helix transcriptional regulator [Streptomyces sp. NPDC088253]|uniref:winged helix-turn-helix transcriptional regulator n=1 Tax=Streptomyces sp. NPDC088253 TaxID=3365846 RepID=UPI00382096EE
MLTWARHPRRTIRLPAFRGGAVRAPATLSRARTPRLSAAPIRTRTLPPPAAPCAARPPVAPSWRRWTLRVIWELHGNGSPIGFRDLQRRCDGMSSRVLSTRLTELREAGVAASTAAAAQPAWHLTALGDDLVTAMGPLLDWSRAWAERR